MTLHSDNIKTDQTAIDKHVEFLSRVSNDRYINIRAEDKRRQLHNAMNRVDQLRKELFSAENYLSKLNAEIDIEPETGTGNKEKAMSIGPDGKPYEIAKPSIPTTIRKKPREVAKTFDHFTHKVRTIFDEPIDKPKKGKNMILLNGNLVALD